MPTIGQILERNAHRVADRLALVYGAKRYTYKELDGTVNRATRVLAHMGVEQGERVALMAHNSDLFIIAYYAVLKLGAIVVPTNVRLAAPELAYQLEDSGARWILFDPELAPIVRTAHTQSKITSLSLSPITNEASLLSAMAEESEIPLDISVQEADDAQILYTSGTTGRPKGVLMDHHRVIWTGLNIATGVGLREGERLLHVAPLYHSAELDLFLMGGTYVAATHVVLKEFQQNVVLNTLATEKITAFFGVPTMYQFMLRDPSCQTLDLSDWRIGMFGAAPMPPSTVSALGETFPHLQLYNLAGLTEMGPGGVYLGGEELRQYPDAAGRAILNTEARVVNLDGTDVAIGEVGELVLRGETLMKGYWNNPQATAASLHEGWLLTGDLATVNVNGLITLVDRRKDMILTGGMNVYSVEVENAIITHPDVVDCAVIGLSHPDYGETVTAVVHLRLDATLTLAQLRSHCSPLIADYKIPRRLIIGVIPRNASGKVLKYQLREQFA